MFIVGRNCNCVCSAPEAAMEDYLPFAPYASVVLVLIGIVGLIWSRNSAPQKVDELPCEVVSDWRPTGKIDFAKRDINGKPDGSLFCLQTEEYRVLQSMSGTKRVEVRWRAATLEEACQVAGRHNTGSTPLERELPLAATIDGAALVPDPVERHTLDASLTP
jgi:hypothetical protein